MDDFFDDWNDNPKFRAGVKLAVYSVVFFFASVFIIISARNQNLSNVIRNEVKEEEKIDSNLIVLPENYTYKYTVNFNDSTYFIEGSFENNIDTFTKTQDDDIINYKFSDNKYYKVVDEELTEVLESEIYGDISKEYFTIDKINKYLEISKLYDNEYRVYLKDIIYDNETEDYISILKQENKIIVDYTTLIKSFNKDVNKFSYEFEFIGKE